MVGDMPGWAFHNIILFVIREFGHRYDIYHDFCIYRPDNHAETRTDLKKDERNTASNIRYKKELPLLRIPLIRSLVYRWIRRENLAGRLPYDAEGKFRRLHPSDTYDLLIFLDYYMDRVADFSHVTAKRRVKGIYTDGFPPKGIRLDDTISPETFQQKYLADADVLVVGSESIRAFYAPLHPSVFFANQAYDETLFVPRKKDLRSSLVLGWSGNPDREFKGYHQLIVPVVENLCRQGYDIELQSRFSGPFEKLPAFWQNVDLAVIASDADAGPSLFMEACLCGVPSVSTRIGMPNLVIRDGENGLFCERTMEGLTEKIKILYHNRDLLARMARSIRNDYVAVLGVEAQKHNWEKLFREVLA